MSEAQGTKGSLSRVWCKVRIPPTLSLSDARCPKCGTALDGKSAPNNYLSRLAHTVSFAALLLAVWASFTKRWISKIMP